MRHLANTSDENRALLFEHKSMSQQKWGWSLAQDCYIQDCNELRHDNLPEPTFKEWAKAYRVKVWGL
jgi:hypothetical protein